MKAAHENFCIPRNNSSPVWLILCIGLILGLYMGGCTNMVAQHFEKTVDITKGTMNLPGLTEPVTVSRDALGIPFIEAGTMGDMAMAMGYVHASDRLTQMAAIRLMSEGRLSEMAGASMIDLDLYMRTMNLRKTALNLLKNISPENLDLLERYCIGVNAYLERHKDNMPAELALAGYTPEYWKPIDSIMVYALLDLALSFNLHEEIASLNVAQAIGAAKTAWLLPIYPDEPIPFDEADKLSGIDLKSVVSALAGITKVQPLLSSLGLGGIAASNNWAISKSRTKGNASILCNDTHLLLTMPSMWTMVHVRCGGYDVAGISVSGVPAVIAGYNGHIAWGMTMVMADNQDIFLERLKDIGGRLHYLYKGKWLPTSDRKETITVKGKAPVSITIHETIHGPLLGDALTKEPIQLFQPRAVALPYGIAVSWATVTEDDDSMNAFFSLSSAGSVEEAIPIMKRIRAIALNMVLADRNNIAWQVIGNYPVRTKGRGLMPSPGWTGEYDWTGLLNPEVLPESKNPPEGFIGTANNRTVAKDHPQTLSSSWYWPERAERIAQMASATTSHTARTCMDMQLDTRSLFVPKLKAAFLSGKLAGEITREINSWKDPDKRKKARLALDMLRDFDGDMQAGSNGAALVGVLLDCATRNIFLDELGPKESRPWKSFLVINNESYNATCDHLLIRGDESPFWDNIKTTLKETKAAIIAESLFNAVSSLESRQGSDPIKWNWGALHTYVWETEASKTAQSMGFMERTAMSILWPYFNRGPYPAPGDIFTLNVSAYTMGRDFDTWLIPAMRLVVDFSLEEPMFCVNSSGQSDNPSSPHYDDGIKTWRNGEYITFPFKEGALKAQYRDVLVLTP